MRSNLTLIKCNSVDVAKSREPPKEFRVMKFGETHTSKGVYVLTEQNAKNILNNVKLRGFQLSIDYEHSAVSEVPIQAPAAGWFDLEMRGDGLWAVNVKWTDRASDYLKNAEYRYISPSLLRDEQTKEAVDLQNVALTNLPATYGIEPLVAARMIPLKKLRKVNMNELLEIKKQLAELMGKLDELQSQENAEAGSESAEPSEAPEDISNYKVDDNTNGPPIDPPKKDEENMSCQKKLGAVEDGEKKCSCNLSLVAATAREITGKSKDSEVAGALVALSQMKLSMDTLAAENAKLKEKLNGNEDASLVKEAEEKMLVPPVLKGHFLRLSTQEKREWIANAKPLVKPMNLTASQPETKFSSSPNLTEQEERIKKMFNIKGELRK